MPTVAILWQRFGPYHAARIDGAQAVLANAGLSVVGIEVAGRDHYAWNSASGPRVSLFAEQDYAALSVRQIRRAVNTALDQLQPCAVAVNGWSVPEAVTGAVWCRQNARAAILMSETHDSSGRFWRQFVKRHRVRRCDSALVGGRWHADYLASLGFDRQRIVIGYDCVDNSHFSTAIGSGDELAARQRLGLPRQYFYANTRFLPRKNVDGLLRAYAVYRKECDSGAQVDRARQELANREGRVPSPWHLVITGSGEMEREWKRVANELGVAEFVRWPGFVQYDDLPVYYNLASAFIHVAHQEAWGLVVNEAAAAGLPLIIANRVGAACELLEVGSNGFQVDSRDTAGIARAMTEVAGMSHDKHAAMGKRSKELVAKFGSPQFGEAILRALQIAIGFHDARLTAP